jgi:geranylgeranyl diphosphate synthase type I
VASPEILFRYRERLLRALEGTLGEEGRVAPLVRYAMGLAEADGSPGPGIGGKLLRPALVCFTCEALGGEVERALPLACALELVHNFSLVHDDIQDGDALRRGRPAVWRAFGTPQAINAGDALLVMAFREALAAELPPGIVVAAQRALSSATLRMIEGQVMDLELAGAARAGVGDYLAMARRKTGALLGCALELGALAAGREDLARDHYELGEALGLAFQIRDDILGIWGDPALTGKPAGSDLANRKRSWPVVYALQRSPELAELLGRDPPSVEEALARLEEVGAREAAEAEVRRWAAEARRRAAALPWVPRALEMFSELVAFLTEREA